ncbi:hypothetical protein EON68_00990 [archaeon]|nr:MAG: hypothetical protein EON68_00990 [archaeon]
MSDDDKRQAYNLRGHAGVDQQGMHDADGGFGSEFIRPEDIFEAFFGASRPGRRGGYVLPTRLRLLRVMWCAPARVRVNVVRRCV